MDIVQDILQRVMAGLGDDLNDDLALMFGRVDAEVRRDWGGDRPYIAKSGEAGQEAMSRRNAEILRDWQAGDRIPAIARKHRLSRVRVWQIVREVGG